jgi:hypothetical protein
LKRIAPATGTERFRPDADFASNSGQVRLRILRKKSLLRDAEKLNCLYCRYPCFGDNVLLFHPKNIRLFVAGRQVRDSILEIAQNCVYSYLEKR